MCADPQLSGISLKSKHHAKSAPKALAVAGAASLRGPETSISSGVTGSMLTRSDYHRVSAARRRVSTHGGHPQVNRQNFRTVQAARALRISVRLRLLE